MMTSEAVSFGAVTVVNAIASGRGAAFGIDLESKASCEIIDSGIEASIKDLPGEDTGLIEACAREVLGYFGLDYGLRIRTESQIPPAKGLKSSSAASNAVVLAAIDCLLSEDSSLEMPSDEEVLSLGVKASLKAGVTVTGALDDAAASYFGGYVISDNVNSKIVKREEMPEGSVLLFVPAEKTYTSDVDVERARLLEKESLVIWKEALEGDLYSALTLNGLLYSAVFGCDPRIALAALEAGALAAGLCGTGPSVAAVASDPGRVRDAWKEFQGYVIQAKINNRGAHII